MAPPISTTRGNVLLASAAQTPAMQALRRQMAEGGALAYRTVPAAAQPFFAALLRHLFPRRPIVVVSDGLRTQEVFHQDVSTWLAFDQDAGRDKKAGGQEPASDPRPSALDSRLFFYPAWETLPHDAKLPHADVISERLETLVALKNWASPEAATPGVPAPVVVTSVSALLQRTFPPRAISQRTRTLRRGDHLDPLDLVEWLEDQGYEPEAKVNHKGEIALRGGIVDIFPLTSPWPVRLEFFGDELESLRHFDPFSQISKENIESVTIPPGGELGILKNSSEFRIPGSELPQDGSEFRAPSSELPSKGAAQPGTPPSQPGARNPEPGTSLTQPGTSLATLLDYLPSDALFLLCDPEALQAHAASYAELVPPGDPFFVSWEEFVRRAAEARMTMVSLSDTTLVSPAGPGVDDEVAATDVPRFASLEAFRPVLARATEPAVAEVQRREFFAQLHRWLRQGCAVHLFCNNDGERQRFEEVWTELGLGSAESSPAEGRREAPDSKPAIHLGALSRGFIFEEARLVIVTDAEVFGRYKIQRPRRLKSPHAQTSRSLLDINFTELDEGDFVVHLQHGIGRYLGLQMMEASSGSKPRERAAQVLAPQQECLVIEYASSDPTQPAPKLYVPVSEAHLVSKYVGAGKAHPPLNTLGGGRWQKTKDLAERAVRDVAADLLSIHAARASLAGHSFKPDTPWQREFESAFLYEETPDQWKAIVAAKADMEAPKPMDRLICGDVGYGKTEVAIRAAFKAVMDGRQVAILVPTTVLAQQHFNTFRERMADYPIRVELLSRFRTAREQKRVVQELATGAVDIVIGTHRLVQADIAFKDLGLVVIDEEQRFGVLHKEKFKLLRKLVDVLTLSATPIPRTLYLALTGARDMSTIETPPQDRLPVETIVTEFDERVIRDAILREMNRGGQVFYLHNRVLDIEKVALRLRALVPKARLAVGHGQMHADELEEVMTNFVNGEADVLLSTTIIESGIDIPNANTIIIDRADRFGLSDLYQLRGRVGRYKHQAYAYLLVPRHARLLTDARKRISAIKQYSTLGSGFKIALRDLEIRGAGNLLGAQQSGHITAVGFDLYCQLLKQSVAVLKGEKVKPRVEVQVRLDFLATNPLDETSHKSPRSSNRTPEKDLSPEIRIPREVAVYGDDPEPARPAPRRDAAPVRVASACVPVTYVAEAQQRIEVYRKLAEIMDAEALSGLKAELRDRYGPLPAAVELLLQVTELKLLGAERGISLIECKEDKLMLTRHRDFIMVGGKFPRLGKKEPRARLNEIKRLLQSLSQVPRSH